MTLDRTLALLRDTAPLQACVARPNTGKPHEWSYLLWHGESWWAGSDRRGDAWAQR